MHAPMIITSNPLHPWRGPPGEESTKPMPMTTAERTQSRYQGRAKNGRRAECCIADDNLWRPTRRAEEHYTKDKLSTRRGAVHSIGWLSRGRIAAELLQNRHGPFGRRPDLDKVMVLSFDAINASEVSVQRTDAVPPGRNSEVGDNAASTFMDLQSAGRNMKAGFGDVIPRMRIHCWLRIVNLDRNRNGEVSIGLNNYDVIAHLYTVPDVVVGVVNRRLVGAAAVPEVKLVVVGENIARPSL